MPNFLENLFAQLQRNSARTILREIHGDQFTNVTGGQLLAQIQQAREALRRHNLQPGAAPSRPSIRPEQPHPATPSPPRTVIPTGADRLFSSAFASCERVGLRSQGISL